MCFDVEQDYFNWLCNKVHIDQEDKAYWLVAKDLHRKKFYSLIEHDENRGYDGIELREDYISDNEYELEDREVDLDSECTVFEMLIALAQRIDFETSDPYDLMDRTDRTAFWFWEMMDNLGLTEFDDDSYVELDGQIYVDRIIDDFLERKYSRSGSGGLFPLKSSRRDQRKVEIWYQMGEYLSERKAV